MTITDEQEAIREQANALLLTLDDTVPASAPHAAVQDARRALTALAKAASTITTQPAPDSDDYPRDTCGCGFDIVDTPDGWQHDAAPYFWGDDHPARPA